VCSCCFRDWNPAIDKHLPKKYNITNFKEGKRACKVALQEELGLPVNPDVPLIAFIGRLDYQKGADIVLQVRLVVPWSSACGASNLHQLRDMFPPAALLIGIPCRSMTVMWLHTQRLLLSVFAQAAPWMMSQGVQLVCLGTGSTDLEVRRLFMVLWQAPGLPYQMLGTQLRLARLFWNAWHFASPA
jgi:glycogen synthase